jgi:amino acid transporter
VPRGDVLGVLGLWSAMCFAFTGLEVSGLVGQEVRRPERTLPLGTLVAGLATTAIYILGSVALLVVLNPSELAAVAKRACAS